MWASWTARVWKSPTHARLERLSIHCSSLSYAFVHQKGDYSKNPALCHSPVCISKSTNIVTCWCMKRLYLLCVRLYGPTLTLTVFYVEWQHDAWKKITTYGPNVMTHSLFWLQPLVPIFTICVVYYVSAVACSSNQPSTPVRASERKSMLRLPCFCLFSNQPLSENAIMPFIDSQQPTHIEFSNNAWVNIYFQWLYVRRCCDLRHCPVLERMHNHSKQCP